MCKNELKNWLKLADENLVDSIVHRVKSIKSGKLYETENYIIYTIGVDSEDGHLNGAFCFNDDYAEEMLNEAEKFFKTTNFSYSVWVKDHEDYKLEKILKQKGLKPKREPGSSVMIINEKINLLELPNGFELKRVTSEKEINDFALVTKSAFDKTDEVIECMFSSNKTLIDSNVISFVIYKNDEPVATALTVMSDCIAGIYWVGTIESERGQGLGGYIAQAATNIGFELGAEAVILQASAVGERVYNKLGYKKITLYRSYLIK